jgi:hypothetical protein
MRYKILILLVLISFLFSGCYYFSAKNEIKNAERLFMELKGAGGEKITPYEYCSAESYLEISKIEFSHSDFKKAHNFAIQSKSASEAGLTEIKKKK